MIEITYLREMEKILALPIEVQEVIKGVVIYLSEIKENKNRYYYIERGYLYRIDNPYRNIKGMMEKICHHFFYYPKIITMKGVNYMAKQEKFYHL